MKISLSGEYDTSFIDRLLNYLYFQKKDRGTKMLNLYWNVTVNGFPGIERRKNHILKARISKCES